MRKVLDYREGGLGVRTVSLHPSVTAVRAGVRRELAGLEPGDTVLVACSGGADSTALLAATVVEARASALRVVGAVVDHGLHEASAEVTADVVARMASIGVDETASARVTVAPGGQGIEAAAREARYAVLDQLADHFGAALVLLGHTLDDQAETVLLGLTRGSGARSLAGMRRGFDRYRRPLLDVRRDDTVTACQVEGLEVWTDPANADPGFARVRVRDRVLPVLEDELGPGVAQALARTADQLRADVEALDLLADQLHLDATRDGGALDLSALLDRPPALVTRVLRAAAVDAGASDSELFHVHVTALHRLVTGRVSGQVQLPGRLTAYVDDGRLLFRPTPVEG